MSGFEELPGAISEGVAEQPITTAEVRTSDEDWDDETALGIVLRDADETMAYLSSKALVPLGIENADDMVRGFVPPRKWADGKARSNLSMHVVLQSVEKIVSQLYMSLFAQGKKQPFLIDPIGHTTPEAARANSSLLAWAMKQSKAKEEFRHSLKTCLTYGVTVMRWGWESREQRKKVYTKQPDGKMKGELKVTDIELPICESLDLKQVLVDSTLKRQDVQLGKFVINQYITNGYGLEDLRKTGLYKNLPTQDELASLLANEKVDSTDTLASGKRAVWREFQAKLNTEKSSKDPMTHPLEILEEVTKDRTITVLQRCLVIRNEPNEFGRLNFQSCAFIDVLGSWWGFGIARLQAGEQRLQTGVVNNWIDGLALTLNPVYQLLKGIGAGTQNIPVAPGKVITESGELKPLITPDISKPAMVAIEASDQRASEKVGSNGGSNMPNQAMRTAEGVQAFAGDVITRLQYFLEQYIDLVYLPTLEAYLEMMHEHFTPAQVNEILTAEEGKAFEGDVTDVYNAQLDVQVLGGANMMAKFAAAQLAPMIIQLVSSGPVADQLGVAGMKFDYANFVQEALDLMGWDVENLIVPMSPADLQRQKDQNQAMQRGVAQQQLAQQQHQNDLEDIDAKASGQAGVAVVRTILKNHEQGALQQIAQSQQPPQA